MEGEKKKKRDLGQLLGNRYGRVLGEEGTVE